VSSLILLYVFISFGDKFEVAYFESTSGCWMAAFVMSVPLIISKSYRMLLFLTVSIG
jgi:hypothetical protein